MAQNLESRPRCLDYILGTLQTGDTIRRTGKIMEVLMGGESPLGRPVDGLGDVANKTRRLKHRLQVLCSVKVSI